MIPVNQPRAISGDDRTALAARRWRWRRPVRIIHDSESSGDAEVAGSRLSSRGGCRSSPVGRDGCGGSPTDARRVSLRGGRSGASTDSAAPVGGPTRGVTLRPVSSVSGDAVPLSAAVTARPPLRCHPVSVSAEVSTRVIVTRALICLRWHSWLVS